MSLSVLSGFLFLFMFGIVVYVLFLCCVSMTFFFVLSEVLLPSISYFLIATSLTSGLVCELFVFVCRVVWCCGVRLGMCFFVLFCFCVLLRFVVLCFIVVVLYVFFYFFSFF